MATEQKYMTAEEVASLLRIHLITTYKLAAAGEIKGRRIGRHWRFCREDIEDYMNHGAAKAA